MDFKTSPISLFYHFYYSIFDNMDSKLYVNDVEDKNR